MPTATATHKNTRSARRSQLARWIAELELSVYNAMEDDDHGWAASLVDSLTLAREEMAELS